MTLIDLLMAGGLVQFGRFGDDAAPIKINIGLLPSYPEVLRTLAEQAVKFCVGVDRLVCTVDAVPFGTAVSLAADIPLVYSLGTDAPGVHDLIGAYDVGHPAILLANIQREIPPQLIEKAQRVGLDIQQTITVFGLDNRALVNLGDLMDELVARKRLSGGQREAVMHWLRDRSE
jgi:hypothetical protein